MKHFKMINALSILLLLISGYCSGQTVVNNGIIIKGNNLNLNNVNLNSTQKITISKSTPIVTISGFGAKQYIVLSKHLTDTDTTYNFSFRDQAYSEMNFIAFMNLDREQLNNLYQFFIDAKNLKPGLEMNAEKYSIKKVKSGFGGYIYIFAYQTIFTQPSICKLWPKDIDKLIVAIAKE